MLKPRGREHTTLTETAALVVKELRKYPAVKMIAPGEINNTGRRRAATKYLTVVYTTAGCELLITGQGTQRVAVHAHTNPADITLYLRNNKRLQDFVIKERERKPGI